MTDEFKLRRDATKAAQALALLDNPLLKEAFDNLEREYTQALFLTRPEQPQGRESLYLAVNVLRKVRDHLASIVNDGKLANRELKDLADTAERQKTWAEV